MQLFAQTDALPGANKNQQLEQRLDAVAEALNATRQELNESRAEIRALQREVLAMKASATAPDASSASAAQSAIQIEDAVAQLKEDQEVVQAEVAGHEQSKVETQSKYPLKITGLVLFNSFVNDGAIDNIDAPVLALYRTPEMADASTGATLRQTVLGFDASGPSVFGAESHADLRVDFFGGPSLSGYSANGGMLRMRTAHAELGWRHTHVAAVLDKPLVSPLSPTSMAVVGVSPMAWSGNLWEWLPQIELSQEVRLGGQHFRVDAGAIDVSDPGVVYNSRFRQTSAAERSRYPGSELRLSYASSGGSGAAAFGIGGYWSPHRFDYGQHTNAWAGTVDWMLPLPARLEFSGEFYRGSALGGLGGGVFKDVVSVVDPGPDQYTHLEGLNALGGWAQLKFRMAPKLEWNAAAGQDNGYASQLRRAQLDYSNVYGALARNQTVFGNFIYRPSAYLQFSLEYRRIRTWQTFGRANTAQPFVLSAGYEF